MPLTVQQPDVFRIIANTKIVININAALTIMFSILLVLIFSSSIFSVMPSGGVSVSINASSNFLFHSFLKRGWIWSEKGVHYE